MKNYLLIVDPQNDFCDRGGALSVKGADEDCERLVGFMEKHGRGIERVIVTMDSHVYMHIAHGYFWVNERGEHPGALTVISYEKCRRGEWMTADERLRGYGVEYVRELEAGGRYQLCIWPAHCIVGTWGHGVYGVVADALRRYETEIGGEVSYVIKGMHRLVEHYSAVRPEVMLMGEDDALGGVNKGLLETLKEADCLYVGGEALSHCVANTVRDLIKYLGKGYAKKVVLLKDTTSSVPGFEVAGAGFLDEMERLGMRIENVGDVSL